MKLAGYFLPWSFLGVGTDYLLVKLHVFNYTGWKLIYSLSVYICVLSLTYLAFQSIMYYYNKKMNPNTGLNQNEYSGEWQ